MSAPYLVPAGRHQAELLVRRSRFLAVADMAPDVAAARAHLDALRRAHPRAAHHVHAFRVGHGASVVEGMGDDGEPQGTAGRPTMAVLAGSGLGDVALVTVRYFGGVKLGTGGLVRAYTEAAQAVLAGLPTALKVATVGLRLSLPPSALPLAERLLAAHGGEVLGRRFGARVELEVRLPEDEAGAVRAALAELTAGRGRVEGWGGGLGQAGEEI